MDVQGITIDGKTTRDRDDAIWAQGDSRGWTVTVCIANVAAAVDKDSPSDEDAHRRVETSYLAGDRSRPMLPRRFSEGSCTLTEGQERDVMAIRIRLDHSLDPQFIAIDASRLTSKKQLAYEEVPGILGDEKHPLHAAVSPLAKLANGLMEKRRSAGAFVLYDLHTGWVMSEEGFLRRLKDTKETFGYIIVQELMILANSELAKYCAENSIPVPYRNHTARAAAPDRAAMMERVSLGLTAAVPDLDVARKQFSLVMNKADYGPIIDGHYGLNLPAYLHGTSPIRRYADLICQRQILAFAAGKPLPYTAEEVGQIAEHINATLIAKAKEVSHTALERANRQAEKALRTDDLSRLSDREFERVIKVSVRSEDFNPIVAESFLHKLKAGTASLVDMHFILFKSREDWQPIRKAIVTHLVENPHKGTSIVTIAAQTDGWSEPKYKIQRIGEGHLVVHDVQVSFAKPGIESPKLTASSSKVAKRRAVVEAIARAVGEEIPAWSAVVQEAEKVVGIPDPQCENPVGGLSEYCQFAGTELPVYETERAGGADHESQFVVTCKALRQSATSPPKPTKKSAKKQSARMLLRILHVQADQ